MHTRKYFTSVLLGTLQNKKGTSLAVKSKEKDGKGGCASLLTVASQSGIQVAAVAVSSSFDV